MNDDTRREAEEPSVIDRLLRIGGGDQGGDDTPEMEETSHSVGLLFENFIKAQISMPISPANAEVRQKDFLGAITAKVQVLEARADGSDELSEIKGAYRSILLDLLNSLEKSFAFNAAERGGAGFEDADLDSLSSMVHNLYSFLIIDRVDNIVAYLKSRIFMERKDLVKRFKPEMEDRKNMSMAALKVTMRDFDDVVVMFFLDKIIEFVASEHVPFSQLMTTLRSEFEDEVSLVGTAGVVDGDNEEFSAKYLAPVLSSPEMTKVFQRLVYMSLLEVLPQKKQVVAASIKKRRARSAANNNKEEITGNDDTEK